MSKPVKVIVAIPRVPNFVNIGGTWVPLSLLSNSQINDMARGWKAALLKNRERQLKGQKQ